MRPSAYLHSALSYFEFQLKVYFYIATGQSRVLVLVRDMRHFLEVLKIFFSHWLTLCTLNIHLLTL